MPGNTVVERTFYLQNHLPQLNQLSLTDFYQPLLELIFYSMV